MRIARIENALKGVVKNPAVQTAINDFETLIGNRYGELDTQLFEFLREVERSGIVKSIFENALIGRDSPELKRIFIDLHARIVGPGNGAGDLLFERMVGSFSVTLTELSKDRLLLEAFRLHRAELDARLDKMDLALVSLGKKERASGITFEVLQGVLLKIAKGLQGSYRSVRVETTKGARSVEITRIYIPPKLTYRDTKKNAAKVAKVARFLKKSGSGPVSLELFDAQEDNVPEPLTSITYQDLRLLFNRVVVLGDPGGGKSTLCQHLCHDLSRQAVASLQSDSKQLTAQLQKFPLRVILRGYEKARTLEPQLSIFDFISRDLKNHVVASDAEIDEALKYLLVTGRAVLAFDGLDEILATAQRRDFVDLVMSFCSQFPLCPVLVTSRLVGYDDAHLPDEFDELILEKFDDDEVLNYANKFMKVVGGHEERLAVAKASAFYRQTTTNAADLRRNPLMLGLMAWLFNMRGDVPSNRPEIYRECAVLMFEKWDPDRDIKADVPSNFDRLQLFSSVASKIFGNPEFSGGVKEEWLELEVRSFFQEVYENKAQAYTAAKALVSFITGRAWVMSDVGDKVFAFTHQTFLEYFFARYIDDMHDTVKEVISAVMPRVLNREWDMVSHLSLQIKTHRNLRRQNEALDELRSALAYGGDKRQQSALISFSARSLEYLAGAEVHIKPLLVEIVEHTLIAATREDMSAWKDVSQCSQCCIERREFVGSVIVDVMAQQFRHGDLGRRLAVANAIGPLPERYPRVEDRLPRELSDSVRESLRSFVTERIERSAFFAGRAWEWYGLINRDLVAKHGIPTYFETSLGGIGGVDGLTGITLCASKVYHAHFPGIVTRRRAIDALIAIGSVGFSSVPLRREALSGGMGSGPPLRVWERLLAEFGAQPAALAGCLFAMMLSTELAGQHEEVEDRVRMGRSRKFSRKQIIADACASIGIQKLKIFPLIEAAAQHGMFRS